MQVLKSRFRQGYVVANRSTVPVIFEKSVQIFVGRIHAQHTKTGRLLLPGKWKASCADKSFEDHKIGLVIHPMQLRTNFV